MNKSLPARWRANFITGLAIVLPVVITLALVKWLFGTVANITDTLLFFLRYLLDRHYIYQNGVSGPMFWYWSLLALILAVVLITVVGRMARNFIGKRLIAWVDTLMLRLPLLNKVYGAIKQLNDTFAASKKTAFQTVVLIEFPRPGLYSLGFITSEPQNEPQARTPEQVVSVFVPTTPNPTSGFLVLAPEDKLVKLDMTVADGIKFIISLGSISPPQLGSITRPQSPSPSGLTAPVPQTDPPQPSL